MITDEKRAFKRVKRSFTVKFKHWDTLVPASCTSISKNISPGGVYFTSVNEFSIGQLLDCRIDIPGVEEEGRWVARVVRCDHLKESIAKTFGIAVEFIRSFGDSEKNLKNILKKS